MVDFTDFGKYPGGDDPPPGSAGASANALSMMVDGIAEQQEMIASMQARVAVLMCEAVRFALRNDRVFVPDDTSSSASRQEWTRRALIAEFAVAFRLSERKIASMMETSEALVTELPETLSALQDGSISLQHAEIMVAQAAGLDREHVRQFESTAIATALSTTPPQFKTAAVSIRERLNPDSAAERKREAVKDRHIHVTSCPNGMGYLDLYGPIEDILSIEAVARNTARSLKAAGDGRTLSQIATDAVLDAVKTGFTVDLPAPAEETSDSAAGGDAGDDAGDKGVTTAGSGAEGVQARRGRLRPTVHVTVPVMTLLGRSAEPGTLDGYGPIDADTARRLATAAPSFTRLLTHPETGAVLSVGRDRYTVPADLRKAVEIRDETCGFPGCNRPASSCDLDHRLDWQFGGETDFDNLAALCPSHHPVKHETTWSVERTGDGKLVWTSPLGRHYVIRPYAEPGYKRVVKFEDTTPETVPAEGPQRARNLPENPPF
ncbi:HNH endonuclease signature motif containing protein [Paramicrobacterium agarici]|uniref:HNH endonuclease signature motif containing protein n=1 Tax=Paramicrobacterium agarici TaxID=630514 RepID=UPI00116FEE3B|nr:HNH endonuclease signature motif containing protein [Microbacterium agarici]TQO22381.1 uncharacterized protein DUF222 [Microbacterium agarici]